MWPQLKEQHTDICCQTADGREEDFDIWTRDELRVHSSRVFEECATQQGLGTEHMVNSKNPEILGDHSHPKPLSDTRKIPHGLDGCLADSDFHARVF